VPADDTAPKPALSIISAVHDTEPHLADMIDSVVAQTVGDWELIIVDNGMSDEVVRIVDKYADDVRIRLLRQEYRGLAGGVDAAAAVARGDRYAVVPGDGLLMPTFCERVAAVLAEHPEIDVLCIDALPVLDGQDQPPGFRQRCGIVEEPGIGYRVGLVDVIRRSGLYTTAAIRASAWAAGGGYSGETPQVDSLAMCLRMLAAGCDLRVLPEQLGRYRMYADTPDDAPVDHEYEDSVERAFLQVADLSDDPQVLAELRSTLRKIRYERALRLSREALRNDDPSTARKQTLIALRHRPSPRPALLWLVLRIAPGAIAQLKSVKRRITGLRGRGAMTT
jgi:glycosyltransferase involved in cell wall biosynthesis